MKLLSIRKITWEIRDKSGKLISFETQRPNSYVQHLVNMIYSFLANTVFASQTDTSDAAQSMSPGSSPPMSVAAENLNGTYGLVVGTGSTAVAVGQTKLITKIAHGNSSGQLSHGAVTINAPSTVSNTRSFTVQRTFTNNSGGTITVNEIGIYIRNGSLYFMIERALSTKAISTGTSATLTYTIATTV